MLKLSGVLFVQVDGHISSTSLRPVACRCTFMALEAMVIRISHSQKENYYVGRYRAHDQDRRGHPGPLW
jgi:hypothetical protein